MRQTQTSFPPEVKRVESQIFYHLVNNSGRFAHTDKNSPQNNIYIKNLWNREENATPPPQMIGVDLWY